MGSATLARRNGCPFTFQYEKWVHRERGMSNVTQSQSSLEHTHGPPIFSYLSLSSIQTFFIFPLLQPPATLRKKKSTNKKPKKKNHKNPTLFTNPWPSLQGQGNIFCQCGDGLKNGDTGRQACSNLCCHFAFHLPCARHWIYCWWEGWLTFFWCQPTNLSHHGLVGTNV